MTEIALDGGVANNGAVIRSGDHVLRPTNPHTPSIHRFLTHLSRVGFEGASRPVGVDPDGRERLVFIAGDVPLPPYPDWAQTDQALASVATLMRAFHDTATTYEPSDDDTWSHELDDPEGGPIVCHNDVCLENVVFVDGRAVALLDFDFAAPGRAVYDISCFARMCVPVDDELSRARLGWGPVDVPGRLRLVADSYGLDGEGRSALVEALDDTIARGGEFVLRRVQAGDQNFIDMWNAMGGMERFDRRRAWWTQHRSDIDTAMR